MPACFKAINQPNWLLNVLSSTFTIHTQLRIFFLNHAKQQFTPNMDNIYSKLTSFFTTNHSSLWGLARHDKRRRERILPHLLTHPHLIAQTLPSIHSGHHRGNTHLLSLLGVSPSLTPTDQLPQEAPECVVYKVSPRLKEPPPKYLCPSFQVLQKNLQPEGQVQAQDSQAPPSSRLEGSGPSFFHPGSVPHSGDLANIDTENWPQSVRPSSIMSALIILQAWPAAPLGPQSPISAKNPATLV